MKKRDKPLRRRQGNRPEKQRFLIYCEGQKTETNYFNDLKRELRAATVTIKLGHQAGGPYKLVEEAIGHQRRAPRQVEDRYEAYDRVWCVFDVEAPQPHPWLLEAAHLAARHDIQCAISNPCFELWLYLHFRPHTAYVTTDAMARLLEGCGCGYSRGSKHFDFSTIRQARSKASGRARQLHERHSATPDIVRRNPWTSVDALVDELFRHAAT